MTNGQTCTVYVYMLLINFNFKLQDFFFQCKSNLIFSRLWTIKKFVIFFYLVAFDDDNQNETTTTTKSCLDDGWWWSTLFFVDYQCFLRVCVCVCVCVKSVRDPKKGIILKEIEINRKQFDKKTSSLHIHWIILIIKMIMMMMMMKINWFEVE